MLESILTSVLQRRLGQFCDGFDSHAAKLSIWRGKIVLRDVKLRRDALYTLGLPLAVRSGVVGQLSVEIPWRHLGRDPVVIKIEGVSVVIGSLEEDAAFDDKTLREWAWRRKELELQSLWSHAELLEDADVLREGATTPGKVPGKKSSPRGRKGFTVGRKLREGMGKLLFDTKKLASKVLDHLRVEVAQIHVRYEDDTHSHTPFTISARLEAMTTSRWATLNKSMTVQRPHPITR